MGQDTSEARTTVVIPFLNGTDEDMLQETIDSFNGTNVKYIVARNDGELHEALNKATDEVDTEFVMYFGADDVMLPGCVEMLEGLIWNVDVAYPSMILTDENLKPESFFNAEPYDALRLERGNYIPGGGSLCRVGAVRAVGGFRELPIMEDWDLFLRMSRAGYSFKAVPEARFLYRQRADSRNKKPYDQVAFRKEVVGKATKVEATFYYQKTPVTTYLRCVLPARYLPAKTMGYADLVATEEDVTVPNHEGTAVFQFPGNKFNALLSTVVFPEHDIRTMVEVDDNYLITHPHRKRQGWGKKIGDGMADTVEGHRYIAERVDGVIVTTEYLASQYRKVNPNVFVCPHGIDPKDWPQLDKPDDGKLRIGWFASRSHQGDSVLIRKALEWASKQADVEIWTMGIEPGFPFPHVRLPWTNDHTVYFKLLQQLDIGVAPIVATPWAISRSDLKALEYAMAGAVPILSDVPPYAGWDDTMGIYKCKEKKDFHKVISHLVTHRDEMKEAAEVARQYVLSNRTFPRAIQPWKEAIHA